MSSTRIKLTEDWAVVLLGFLIILLAVAGLSIPIPQYDWNDGATLAALFTATNGIHVFFQFLFAYAIVIIGAFVTGKPIRSQLVGFPFVFLLTIGALILSGNLFLNELGLETVIFSLLIGLLVGNLFKLPQWFKESLNAELLVKIGLVLLGTRVIFSDILKAGSLGLVQSLIVVLSVWYFAFWLCRKFKVDDELTMMISSAVSICGVSAAIATSGAIKGDSKKLSYVVSMVLIAAIPMMIGMPYLADALGLPEEVTGAWLGGSIDTTGAVVASGSLVGERALEISTIVKFSQNVLLGIAALAISIYWTYRGTPDGEYVEKPGLGVIWERFPKFVLGFIGASLLFSFVLDAATVKAVTAGVKSIQGLWFALAFTSIGLETNFKELLGHNSIKPFYIFLVAQTFNILVTLVVAWWLFG